MMSVVGEADFRKWRTFFAARQDVGRGGWANYWAGIAVFLVRETCWSIAIRKVFIFWVFGLRRWLLLIKGNSRLIFSSFVARLREGSSRWCGRTKKRAVPLHLHRRKVSSQPAKPAGPASQPASQASIRWLAASTENWKKCFRCTERLGSKICPTGLPQISQSGFAGGSDSLLLSCLAILYSGKSFFVRTRGSRCARIDARQTDHLEVLKGFWLIFLRFSSGNGCSCVVLEV